MGRRESGEDQVARFLRADPDLIAEVNGHAAKIVRYKGYFIPESERLEIVQEVMVQLWHALAVKKLKLREPILALTETIACRRCVDWMRRHRSTEGLSETAEDSRRRPDEALLESERQDLARRVLAEMKAPCTDLMRQILDEGRSYARVAKEQGGSEHALRTRMWQCLKEAREILKRLTDDDPRRSHERPR